MGRQTMPPRSLGKLATEVLSVKLGQQICRKYGTTSVPKRKRTMEQVARCADRLSVVGAEPRLRIMQLLLSAHPKGLVAGQLQEELGIPGSVLLHHLDQLRNEGLVQARRESTLLHYSADTEFLWELIQFVCMERRTPNKALRRQDAIPISE